MVTALGAFQATVKVLLSLREQREGCDKETRTYDSFTGEACSTKKSAEQSAAKIALLTVSPQHRDDGVGTAGFDADNNNNNNDVDGDDEVYNTQLPRLKTLTPDLNSLDDKSTISFSFFFFSSNYIYIYFGWQKISKTCFNGNNKQSLAACP